MRIFALLLLITLSNIFVFAQGNIDGTFGTNGTTKINTPIGFNATGGAIQTNGNEKDKIVVGGYLNDKFQLYRLLKDGQQDTSFGNGGIAVSNSHGVAIQQSYGKGIAVDRNDFIFAGGTSGTKCVLTKFSPNGTNPQNLTIPLNGLTNCGFMNLTAKENHIYLAGIKNISNNSTKILIYRIDATAFSLDNTWNNTGFAEITVGAKIDIGMRLSLAINYLNRVYIAAECFRNGVPTTIVLGLKFDGTLLTSGFGNIKPDFTPRNGAYSISMFIARDLIFYNRLLFLGGVKINSPDFHLLKMPESGNREFSYQPVDMKASEFIDYLALSNKNKIIGVGQILGFTGYPHIFGIAKYEPNTESLTTSWTPGNLQMLQRTTAPVVANYPTFLKDRRNIIVQSFESLRGVLSQSSATNRIMLVSMTGMSSPFFAVTALKDN